MLGFPMGMGMAPELHPDVWGRSGKKFQITYPTMLNNFCFMKHALKSVPGLADVGSSMGMGTAPELHPDVWMDQKKVSND